MTDHLHPAIDIPGEGLWDGARIAHRDGDGVTVEDQRGCSSVLCVLYDEGGDARLALPPTERLSLRVDDPRGLGLAGLAGRVAERAGLDPRIATMDGLGEVAFRLAGQPWALPYWRRYLDNDDEGGAPRVIREAATLLARLDRLVAATWPDDGIVLAPGTVPDWRRDGAEWVLTVGPVGCARYAVDVLDPIEAAGAALEAHDG